jgi:hypothetical protein
MRHQIFEAVQQLFLPYDTSVNEADHIDDSSLSDFDLGFADFPLNCLQQHFFEELLAQRTEALLEFRHC